MDRRSPASSVEILDAVFARRKYMHFDEPFERVALESAVRDPSQVAKWAFLPFIRNEISTKKIRRAQGGKLEATEKLRPICFASHRDAALYAYYAMLISPHYEEQLVNADLHSSVTAFRRLGISNVHLASDAFNWIDENRPCVALAFDVKSFFDSLDHKILKHRWARTIGYSKLPDDHFLVFQSLTKFAYVERSKLLGVLGLSKYNLRKGGRRRLCSPEEFRTAVRGAELIATNSDSYGIPQGSPISAILSNIYMFEADQALHRYTTSVGGLYRRYCDDILLVVPPAKREEATSLVHEAMSIARLEIQSKKTLVCHFLAEDLKADKPLQYLGLVFDGLTCPQSPYQ